MSRTIKPSNLSFTSIPSPCPLPTSSRHSCLSHLPIHNEFRSTFAYRTPIRRRQSRRRCRALAVPSLQSVLTSCTGTALNPRRIRRRQRCVWCANHVRPLTVACSCTTSLSSLNPLPLEVPHPLGSATSDAPCDRSALPCGLASGLPQHLPTNHIQDRDPQVKQASEAPAHGSLTQRSTSAPIRPKETCILACKFFSQPCIAFLTREEQTAVRAQPKMLSQIFPEP